MRVRKRSRAGARLLRVTLAAGWLVLPFEAVAGSSEPRSPAAADTAAKSARATQPAPLSRYSTAGPFDLPAGGEPASPYAATWREARDGVAADGAILSRCRAGPEQCPPAAQQLLAIIEGARLKEGRGRIGEVNRAINLAVRYRRDAVRHGTADTWAAPLETLTAGEGDCEDYAIAKYLALHEAGIAPRDLRLVVVWDARLQQLHAVLTARVDGRWLVLDNRRLLLLEDHDVSDYVALTALGEDTAPVLMASDGSEDATHVPIATPEYNPS